MISFIVSDFLSIEEIGERTAGHTLPSIEFRWWNASAAWKAKREQANVRDLSALTGYTRSNLSAFSWRTFFFARGPRPRSDLPVCHCFSPLRSLYLWYVPDLSIINHRANWNIRGDRCNKMNGRTSEGRGSVTTRMPFGIRSFLFAFTQ